VKMVFTAGALFAFNIALTLGLSFAATRGMNALGLTPFTRTVQFAGSVLAFISVWVMFLLIYRYLPSRKIHWRTCLVAATFAGVFFEILKQAFGWYVANMADYKSTYGNLATLIILFLYLYYIGMIFILGGEIAQVDAIVRIRRQQKERIG
jgi:membrane protein